MKNLTYLLIVLITISTVKAQDAKVTTAVLEYNRGEYANALNILNTALDNKEQIERAKNITKAHAYRAKCIVHTNTTRDSKDKCLEILIAFEDLNEARTIDKEGKYSKMIEEAEELVSIEAINSSYLYYYKIMKEANTSDLNLALTVIQKSEKYQPYRYIVNDIKGQIYLSLRDSTNALREFKVFINKYDQNPPQDPDMLMAYNYYRMALIYNYYKHDLNKSIGTIKSGQSALEVEYQRLMGKKEKYKEEEYQRFLAQYKLAKNDLQLYLLELYRNSPEHMSEAIVEFDHRIKEEPNNYTVHVAYADLITKSNEDKAIELYKVALEINREEKLAPFNLGAIYVNNGREWQQMSMNEWDIEKSDQYMDNIKEEFEHALKYFEIVYSIDPCDISNLDALLQVTIFLDDTNRYSKYKQAKSDCLN